MFYDDGRLLEIAKPGRTTFTFTWRGRRRFFGGRLVPTIHFCAPQLYMTQSDYLVLRLRLISWRALRMYFIEVIEIYHSDSMMIPRN